MAVTAALGGASEAAPQPSIRATFSAALTHAKSEARATGATRARPAPRGTRHAVPDGKGRAATQKRSRARAADTHGTPTGAGADADACDPPYQIDELGIKRYRRECL